MLMPYGWGSAPSIGTIIKIIITCKKMHGPSTITAVAAYYDFDDQDDDEKLFID